MKILSIHIFSLYQSKPIILSSAFSLSFVSNFQMGTLKDFLNFHSRLVIEHIAHGTYGKVELEKGICYATAHSDKIGVTMICDAEYPQRVAIDLLLKIHNDFKTFLAEKRLYLNLYTNDTDVKYENIATEIEEWQDPSKKDYLMILRNELSAIIDIDTMRKEVDDEIKKREYNLEELIQKSNELIETSLKFYQQMKK